MREIIMPEIQHLQAAVKIANASELQLPAPTCPRADILNPSFEDLAKLAIFRMNDIVKCNINDPSPKVFPLAESTRATFFTRAEWKEFGNLETESARLTYTLSRHPERGIPSKCAAILLPLLDPMSILEGWRDIVPLLKIQIESVMREVLFAMKAISNTSGVKATKADFISTPVSYKAFEQVPKISVQLWKQSLVELALLLLQGGTTKTKEFLEIHAFLKDPFGGLRKSFDRQLFIFEYLLDSFRATNQPSILTHEDWQRVLAQAAQESSYLANLELEHVAYLHFHAHQQLPYVYVRLDELSRSEFTTPSHVLEMIAEIILKDNTKSDSCHIVPIAIAFYPSLEISADPLKIIIDGNHRATAFMTLRFLATQLGNPGTPDRKAALREYCQKQQLGRKWEIDLIGVIEELDSADGEYCRQLLETKKELVANFLHTQYIPALVVQEENFHTICNQRSLGKNRVLLLPMHQALFNTESLGFALPRAGQAHGRPLGFKEMPLV